MAVKSEYDIVVEALQILNYISAEEVPTGRDYQSALGKYLVFHEWLKKEFTKGVRWQADAVDERLWTYVAGWFAFELSLHFPTSSEDIQRVKAGADHAQRHMREILARKRLQTTEAEYF